MTPRHGGPATQYPAPVITGRSTRAFAVFAGLSIAATTLVCLPFVPGADYPDWLTLVGRWIPLAIALLVMRLLPVGGTAPQLLGVATGGWKHVLTGMGVAVLTFLALALVPALVAQGLGWAELKGWDVLGGALVALPVWVALMSLSTLGEEAAWRGYAHQLLRHRGFWQTAIVVGSAWAVLHIPQVAIFAVNGEISARESGAALVTVFAMALPLAALVERFRSVWPAVVGHAVPFTATTVVVAQPAGEATFWAFTGLILLAGVLAAAMIRPHR